MGPALEWLRAWSGCSSFTQALLRLYSGLLNLGLGMLISAQVCSPSTQVKAAAAHVERLKRNERKKKIILSLVAFGHPLGGKQSTPHAPIQQVIQRINTTLLSVVVLLLQYTYDSMSST